MVDLAGSVYNISTYGAGRWNHCRRSGQRRRTTIYAAHCMNNAPQQSSRTSHGVPVRLGKKVWCHSSQLATSPVPANPSSMITKKRDRGRLIHHARSQTRPSAPYPRKWPHLRIRWWMMAQWASLTGPKRCSIKTRRGCDVRSEPKYFVDSIAITAIPTATGHHALAQNRRSRRLLDMIVRRLARNDHVMHVTLAQAGAGDAHELCPLLQLRDRAASHVAHSGA